ncbi:MAG TPA: Ni/Fe hydrogenase subunit gamma [Chromatiales bacterium]|nr:Ni/Fe hydrogenase subunit gamma [Chromatiales bacterium]
MKHVEQKQGPWALDAFRVVGRRQESADVVSLDLEADSGFGCEPGQFNMLYVFGKGEVPISVSAGCGERRFQHTIRGVGKITADLCKRQPGDVVYLRGPFGNAWPLRRAEGLDVIIVAGGIGLAPVRPVVHHVLRHRDRFGAFTLLCGARTPADLIYADELSDWAGRADIDLQLTVDLASGDWSGSVGLVTKLFDQVVVRADHTLVMTCGPEVMMRFAAEDMVSRGVEAGRIFLSMERNMKCAIGICGHCMYGPDFICRDGPVFSYAQVRERLKVREL